MTGRRRSRLHAAVWFCGLWIAGVVAVAAAAIAIHFTLTLVP